MRKPKSLRAALMAALPELRDEPERLIVWVESGTVRAPQTGNLNFELQYPLSILIEQAASDIAVIALAVVRWLQVEQPDLLAANRDSFAFETDILDATTADVLFTIDLTEPVTVSGDPQAGWQVDYLAEPDPLFTDPVAAVDGLEPIPPLTGVDLDEDPE